MIDELIDWAFPVAHIEAVDPGGPYSIYSRGYRASRTILSFCPKTQWDQVILGIRHSGIATLEKYRYP